MTTTMVFFCTDLEVGTRCGNNCLPSGLYSTKLSAYICHIYKKNGKALQLQSTKIYFTPQNKKTDRCYARLPNKASSPRIASLKSPCLSQGSACFTDCASVVPPHCGACDARQAALSPPAPGQVFSGQDDNHVHQCIRRRSYAAIHISFC